jgi:hypothetical protein
LRLGPGDSGAAVRFTPYRNPTDPIKPGARPEGPSAPGRFGSADVVVEVAVKSDPNYDSTLRSGGPSRTDKDRFDRASRSKQLLVAVHDPIAPLDVGLRRETSSALTRPLESAVGTRSPDPVEACATSNSRSRDCGAADDPARANQHARWITNTQVGPGPIPYDARPRLGEMRCWHSMQ